MSFLAGRLAGTEGAFFANQSKIAAARLREKLGDVNASPCPVPSPNDSSTADVLPEILRHSIPLSSGNSSPSTMSGHSSLASVSTFVGANTGSAQQLQLGRHQSPDVLNSTNPLNAWISVPRTTFGPKRWTLPTEEMPLQASTANEIRQDHSTSSDTEKMKAAMEGFSMIAKAFAIATGIIFGGTILAGVIAIKKLQLHTLRFPSGSHAKQFEYPLEWKNKLKRNVMISKGKGKLYFNPKLKRLENDLVHSRFGSKKTP